MKRLILGIASAATLMACATVPSAAAGPTAGLGQTASVAGLHIRPLRVVEDSRCPINARCVWAGRVIVTAEVSRGGARANYNMTLGEPIPYGGGQLTLVAAEPGRVAGQDTARRAYRFTFAFEPR